MIAAMFIAGASAWDISPAYAAPRGEPAAVFSSDQNNACKETPENPQGHLNSNPYCESQVPIASVNADPPACDRPKAQSGGPPLICIAEPTDGEDGEGWGSRRR